MSEQTPEPQPDEAPDERPEEVDPPALNLEHPEYDIIEKGHDYSGIETPEDRMPRSNDED